MKDQHHFLFFCRTAFGRLTVVSSFLKPGPLLFITCQDSFYTGGFELLTGPASQRCAWGLLPTQRLLCAPLRSYSVVFCLKVKAAVDVSWSECFYKDNSKFKEFFQSSKNTISIAKDLIYTWVPLNIGNVAAWL